jgi:type II secretory pathway pseudopilin PulG
MTLVEILVVVGIIALLSSLLIPAISMVKKSAKEAKQMAQFTAIELGLEGFKADFGDYPPSDSYTWKDTTSTQNSAGAIKLAEAMVGLDLMGVNPDTSWRLDGTNRSPYTDAGNVLHASGTYNFYDRTNTVELQKRKGLYVDLSVANPFQWGINLPTHDGLYDSSGTGPIAASADCFVLCDVFGKGRDVAMSDGTHKRAGRPILYYRANPANKFLNTPSPTYDPNDNANLLLAIEKDEQLHTLGTPVPPRPYWNPLYGVGALATAITDPRVSTTTTRVAYKPDSYILISAGADGLYGTSDDIYNFRK